MSSKQLNEDIRREVGQHFVFGFHGKEISEDIKTLIRDYYVGNVILMKRNIESAKQTRVLTDSLQQLAKDAGHGKPLLIGIDQENGLVSAFSSPTAGTQFPGAMALASTGSVELTEQVSAASAAELRLAGIAWVYSPVADVNTDPVNPVIGVRSFGDDPVNVAKYATAVARGLSRSGIVPTGKHFPGHGDTHVDSHLALPVIQKTREELEKEELVPFVSLITSGIPCIMTGHMALPLVTGTEDPCSLSKHITTDLLRGDLGFKGVVVTDCLEMDAIAEPKQGGCGVQEGAFRAVVAGADVVMICHTFQRQKEAVERIYKAIEDGLIDIGTLKHSGERIKEMKASFAGDWEQQAPDWEAKYAELHHRNLDLSRQVYPKTAKIVWNSANALPLVFGEKRVLVFTPEMEAVNRAVDAGAIKNTAGPSYLALAQEIGKRVNTTHIVYGPRDQTKAIGINFEEVGGVVFVMRNANLGRWQLEYLEKLELRKKGVQVVLVSSCGPYDLRGIEEEYIPWTGYVFTHEFTAEGLCSWL